MRSSLPKAHECEEGKWLIKEVKELICEERKKDDREGKCFMKV